MEDQHLDYDNMWCMIGGTSTCDFISTHQRYFTQGVWGPYYDAIFPGYYVREAGQSTTGILMEHVIKAHPDFHNVHKDKPIHEVINFLNQKLLKKPYMNRLNVNPCYHGSRLLAYPNLRGLSLIAWSRFAILTTVDYCRYVIDFNCAMFKEFPQSNYSKAFTSPHKMCIIHRCILL